MAARTMPGWRAPRHADGRASVPPGFEVYRRQSRRGPAFVRVYRSRHRSLLGFSAAAWRQLGEPQAVVFCVDRAERLIGFRPAARSERNAYCVTGGRQHVVSATMLLRLMGDPPPGRYELRSGGDLPAHIDLAGGLLGLAGTAEGGEA